MTQNKHSWYKNEFGLLSNYTHVYMNIKIMIHNAHVYLRSKQLHPITVVLE